MVFIVYTNDNCNQPLIIGGVHPLSPGRRRRDTLILYSVLTENILIDGLFHNRLQSTKNKCIQFKTIPKLCFYEKT